MHVTIVYVDVRASYVEQFREATRANHEASIKEEGNLRFDILQSKEDPNKFVLYEAYIDKQAAALHKESDHYLLWRDTVADWMASPRKGVAYQGLYPELGK